MGKTITKTETESAEEESNKKPSAPKKVSVKKESKKQEPVDPKGERTILGEVSHQNKAMVQVGKEKFRVTRHRKNSTGQMLLGLPGREGSVDEGDWLKGKVDLGLKSL